MHPSTLGEGEDRRRHCGRIGCRGADRIATHAVPRTVALLGTQVPIAFLPMLYAYAAVGLTALCLAVPLEGLTSERWRTRWALVLAVLLTPASGELWATVRGTACQYPP